MERSTIIASIVVAAMLGLGVILWLAPLFATVRSSESPVATMKHTYSDVSKVRPAVREIAQVMTENRFVLNRPPVTRELIQLSYFREIDGVEVLIEVIGEPTVLEIYIYDKHRKGTWPAIKDKIEVEMNRGQ